MFKVKNRDCHRYCFNNAVCTIKYNKSNTHLILLFFILMFSAVLFTACSNHKKSEIITNAKEMHTRQNARDALLWCNQIFAQKEQCFNDFFDSLTIEEKICQLFIENLEGKNTFTPIEKLRDISGSNHIDAEARKCG